MFDHHIICKDGFRNTVENDRVVGFEFQARLPYYRGLGLSMVEDLIITIDGEAVARENIRFSVRGRTWSLDEMETCYDDRWNFGEKATIIVLREGGLSAGPHRLKLGERLRISYLPFVPTTSFETQIELAA
ncbi:C-glycoside deglycosidase beta subunit domain-containing protein [Allorhizobium terrae]|uniref:C-deglycosylation enzyme beta subunit n=1 Tax=Allorhizobium terrae TaxID=1848972 RepID=A0A4S3ZYS9_9HYPH|nr:DUF6379 domain-containing protein [Allorhizobium terrae]THF50796.1 hypothetical protein E6C51_08070 [Allorhizobium terrae]